MNKKKVSQKHIEDWVERLTKWIEDNDSDTELSYMYDNGLLKGELVLTSSELDGFDYYYPLYLKAKEIEQTGSEMEAFKIYMVILSIFSPKGTSYFDSPFYIAEKHGFYSIAEIICDQAINAIRAEEFNADSLIFFHMKERIIKKTRMFEPNIFAGRLNFLKNVINSNSDINKNKLFSLLEKAGMSQSEIEFLINQALIDNEILAEKKGRSYRYTAFNNE